MILVLDEYAELFEERDDQNEELGILARQRLHKQAHYALVHHLHLGLDVLGQVEQQVEGDAQQLLLLEYEPLELFDDLVVVDAAAAAVGCALPRCRGALRLLVFVSRSRCCCCCARFLVLAALVELHLPRLASPQLEFDNLHSHVADLVVGDERMELREAREAEERVDDVGGDVDAALPVFLEHARQAVEHRLVLEELLEVVRIARQLEDERRAAYLRLQIVLVEHLGVVVEIVDVRRLVDVVDLGILELLAQLHLAVLVGAARRRRRVLAILQVVEQLLHFAQLRRMDERALGDHFFGERRQVRLRREILQLDSIHSYTYL